MDLSHIAEFLSTMFLIIMLVAISVPILLILRRYS